MTVGLPVVDEAGTTLLTADAADAWGARFAGSLAAERLPAGSRILFRAANCALLLAAIHGTLRSGHLPVVVSDKLTDRELEEVRADTEPAVEVTPDALPARMSADAVPLAPTILCRPVHFTSGTSGRPKGVWSGWLDDAASTAFVAEEREAWRITSADRHLVCAPMSHSAPLRFPLVTLASGGSVLVPPAFDASVISRLLATDQATTTFMAPAHLQRLLEQAPPDRAELRLVAHAGSSCPDRVRRAARDLFGDDALREFYGSTEGQFTICTPAEHDARPGTVGRARPGRRLRIGDDDRIWCAVPPHARFTYWRDADKTREAWDGDWFTVGDLGRLDDDGYLYLEGRRSDLVISGGVNVYPAEVERVVLGMLGVREAGAFGVDDPRWGQRLCLAVVGDVTAAEVTAFCAERLAPAKRPKSVHVVDALPLSHSGKVDRLRLPRMLGLTS